LGWGSPGLKTPKQIEAANGWIYFEVLNGGWEGSFKNGRLRVENDKHTRPAEIVWKGNCPDGDYNSAIEWIEKRLNSNPLTNCLISAPPVEKDPPYDGILYDADPDCKHKVEPQWSGVKCSKCNGWFCY